jgi:DNA-binding GntR family transcriptional regulator
MFAAIDHLSLHAAVAARLRTLIIEGQLAPGARLNERVLCEQLQVSRTPLREAFKMLAGEQLVELLPNRGAVVASLDPQAVAQLFEVLASLEGLGGALAAQRITADELAEIRALHFEMRAAHARRDLPAYFKANMQIHERINAAARNAVLTQTYQTLNLRIHALRYRSNVSKPRWDEAIAEHDAILESLEKRDGKRLRSLLESHLDHKREVVLGELSEATAAAPNSLRKAA